MDMIDVIVIIYLDDILIYSDNITNTRLMSEKYFADSALTDFFALADKCEFHVTSCKYLGYMLSPEGPHHGALQSPDIQDWPEPERSKTSSLS